MLLPYPGLLFVIAVGVLTTRILSQVEWWQRKEYRADRVLSQLWSKEITALVSPPFIGAAATALLGWGMLAYHQVALAQFLGVVSLVLIAAHDSWQTVRRGLRRPKATAKAMLLTILVSGATAGIALQLNPNSAVLSLQLATLALAVTLLVPGGVWMISLPVELRKKDIMAHATKIRRASRATVLGITGSYGKTSTKFFLQQLLKDEKAVIATADHRNSALAVAQDVIHRLQPDTATYIVEMGAYRRGEIREICEIVQPKLGLLTAIGNQHVALFGSISNIVQAKWELIDALPVGGTAILNADNSYIVDKSKELRQKIVWYSIADETSVRTIDVKLSAIHIKATQITATLHLGTTSASVTMPLVSRAMLGSATAAAAGAYALRVPTATIFRNIQQLLPYPRTMEYRRNSRQAAIIDDSYSANQQGVLAAIEHLATFSNMKKVVVLTPLIELGQAGSTVHQKIGAALARSGAQVYVTNATYQADLLRGGQKVSPTFSLTVKDNPEALKSALQEQMGTSTVILLEGRLPEVVRQAVLS